MKSLYLRSMAAIACAASLAACGGGDKGNLVLNGSVTGLSKPGLVLSNGGATTTVAAGAGSFVFSTAIGSDDSYDVQIQTPPTGAKCTVLNGKGKGGNFNGTPIVVSCLTNQYKLGGTVSGLDTTGLVLINTPDTLTLEANAGTFTFGQTVGDGSVYGITVLEKSQPPGKTCRVVNGSGTMGTADVANVQVICLPQ